MQGLSRTCHERRASTRARSLQLFRHITLPAIRPVSPGAPGPGVSQRHQRLRHDLRHDGRSPAARRRSSVSLSTGWRSTNFDFGGASAVSVVLILLSVIGLQSYAFALRGGRRETPQNAESNAAVRRSARLDHRRSRNAESLYYVLVYGDGAPDLPLQPHAVLWSLSSPSAGRGQLRPAAPVDSGCDLPGALQGRSERSRMMRYFLNSFITRARRPSRLWSSGSWAPMGSRATGSRDPAP